MEKMLPDSETKKTSDSGSTPSQEGLVNPVITDFESLEAPQEDVKLPRETAMMLSEIKFALDGLDFSVGEDEAVSRELIELRSAQEADVDGSQLMMLAEQDMNSSCALLGQIEDIPEKLAFKIGEAADIVGVKQYVLRYWESEFDQLKPKKSKNNQRIYSRRDVENALLIKKLLYKDRFSIEGARTALRQLKSQIKEQRDLKSIGVAQEKVAEGLRDLIQSIKALRSSL